MRRRIRLFAVVVVALAALAGCGSGEVSGKGHVADGAQLPHSKPSEPADIHQSTDQGAKAAAQYWLGVDYYSFYSGDTKPLNDISLPECENCKGTIDNIRKHYDQGSKFVGDPFVIHSQIIDLFEPNKVALVKVEFETGRATLVGADGTQSLFSHSKIRTLEFELHWQDNTWKVAQFDGL